MDLMPTITKLITETPQVIATYQDTVTSIDVSASPIPVKYKRGPYELILRPYPFELVLPTVVLLPDLKPKPTQRYLSMWSAIPFTVSMEVEASNPEAISSSTLAEDEFDESTYVEQHTVSAFYSAIAKVDGSGYVASRVDSTTDVVTEFEDALPIPTDLTTLTYS